MVVPAPMKTTRQGQACGWRLCHVGLVAVGVVLTWGAAPALAQYYRSYAEIGQILLDAETDHPDICLRYDLGTSVLGKHIWALRISDNVPLEEDEPEFKYISTMHGNEIVGNEMCLYLIDHLTSNYGTDPEITNLVNEIDIWIVPLMNPDGYEASPRTRRNANNVDLNRNFPDPFTSPNNTPLGREKETGVIMNWSFGESFTLSANIHTGTLVVNYPFDNNEDGASVFTPSPDEDLFVWISEEYSAHNPPMWTGPFYHGITNGAQWYAIDGGMQDWSYRYMGCNEVTLEISHDQSPYPSASELPTYWNNNRDSMLAYLATCLIGVRGLVTDASTGQPVSATVTVVGRDHEVYPDPSVGDYHRMLLPGTYAVTIDAKHYDAVTHPAIVVNEGDATRWDVAVLSPTEVTYPNGGETLVAGTPTTVSWSGNSTTPFHVQYSANYGDIDTVFDGFESGTFDPAYATGGDRSWFITTGTTHSGTYSARAGAITDYEETWLTRTVEGENLSFWYRVSSESNYDWFNFYIDGDRELHRSGTVSWTQFSTTLAPGPHELKWEYTKDVSQSSGSNTVWIDDFEITVDNTIWADIIALTPAGASSTPWTPPAEGMDYKVRVRAEYTDGRYGAWDESDHPFTVGPASGGDIPTVSEWGMVVMTLVMLTVGSVVFRHSRRPGVECVGVSVPPGPRRPRTHSASTAMKCRKVLLPTIGWLVLIAPYASGAGEPADIFTAVRAGDTGRIDAVLEATPDLVNARDRRGHTPLHVAVQEVRIEAAERLLAAGADVKAKNRHGAGVLHLAAVAGHPQKTKPGQRQAITVFLLEHGADARAADNQGLTPLHTAALKGRVEMLAPLVDAKADLMARDSAGRTPLHHAAMYDRQKVMHWLLKKGADANAADRQEETPLHAAARRFKAKAARLLLARSAKVNAKNTDGATPLHLAASAGPKEPEVDVLMTAVAEVLLENGAEVNAVDKAGFTPLHYAVQKARAKLAATLRKHGGTE